MKLNKKTKLFLALGSGLMTTTGIVAPLVCSCSNNNNDIGGLDKKYGVNDAMVKRLEKQCETNYRLTLIEKGITKPEIVNKKMEALKKDLSFLRNEAQKRKSSNSILSDSIINLMSDQYDTKVAREFNPSINFEDEIQDFKNTCVNQITQKMNEEHIPSTAIQIKLNSFEQGFSNIKSSLRGQYDDNLCYMNNLKSQCVSLLDSINQQLDQIAAESTLKAFFENYVFDLKPNIIKETIFWEKLSKEYKDGNDLSSLLKNIFICRDKKNKTVITDFSFDGTEKNGLIHNYIFIPVCRGFTQDIYHNIHRMHVEWQLIKKSNYDLAKTKKDVNIFYNTAATNASVKDKEKSEGLKNSAELFKLDSKEKNFSEYDLPISQNYEADLLKNSVFKEITFEWDKEGENPSKGILYPNCKYEGFFGSISDESSLGKDVLLGIDQLENIGLCIKNKKTLETERLDKILSKISNDKNKDFKEDFDKLHVFEKILSCVDIYSITKVIDDTTHSVTNTIYTAYKHSDYANIRHISQDDHSGFVKICEANCKGMPISRELYENSKKDFDKAYKIVHNYDNNDSSPIYNFVDQCNATLLIFSAINTIVSLIILVLAIECIFAAANLEIASKPLFYISLLIYAICVMTLSILFRTLVKNPTDDFIERVEDFVASDEFKDFKNKIDSDYNNIYKSYDIFKNLPYFSVIKPTIIFYKNLYDQKLYKNFENKRIASGVDKDTFVNKVQKPLHILQWTSLAIEIASYLFMIFAYKFGSWCKYKWTQVVMFDECDLENDKIGFDKVIIILLNPSQTLLIGKIVGVFLIGATVVSTINF